MVSNNSDLKMDITAKNLVFWGQNILTRLSLWNQIFVSVHVSIPGFVSSLKVETYMK